LLVIALERAATSKLGFLIDKKLDPFYHYSQYNDGPHQPLFGFVDLPFVFRKEKNVLSF